MATHKTGNYKHLTISDKANINIMFEKGYNFSQIARKLNKNSSTTSKEIRNHSIATKSASFPHFSLP